MSNQTAVQVARDFLQLMPVFKKNMTRPFEQSIKTLTPMQIHTLFFLRNKQPITMSEFAGEMRISKQQLTFLINKLEANHLIQRRHGENDRRLIKLSITQNGLDFLQEHQQENLNFIVRKLEKLSDEELCQLQASIETIRRIVSQL